LKSSTSHRFIQVAALILAIGSVYAAVTTIIIPAIELGAGVESNASCLSTAVVDFGTSLEGKLSSVTVSDVGPDCSTRWVKLSLFTSADGSGTAVEEIVWRIPAQSWPPISEYTLKANGTTTGTSGSEIWPANESGAAGLSATPIVSSSVNSFLLETSDRSLFDGP
jgi:hypothetical protein